jgi:hypothetical protein
MTTIQKLAEKQIKDVPSKKKLNMNDFKRIVGNLNTSIFNKKQCAIWNGNIISDENEGLCIEFYFRRRIVKLHRLLYANYIGPLNNDQYIKFTCGNKKRCCNIHHMIKLEYKKTISLGLNTIADIEKINILKNIFTHEICDIIGSYLEINKFIEIYRTTHGNDYFIGNILFSYNKEKRQCLIQNSPKSKPSIIFNILKYEINKSIQNVDLGNEFINFMLSFVGIKPHFHATNSISYEVISKHNFLSPDHNGLKIKSRHGSQIINITIKYPKSFFGAIIAFNKLINYKNCDIVQLSLRDTNGLYTLKNENIIVREQVDFELPPLEIFDLGRITFEIISGLLR